MKHSVLLLASAIASAALYVTPSSGANFTDDFSSYASGSVIGAPWQSPTEGADNGTYRKTRIQEDASNFFGQGLANKYLNFYFDRATATPGDTGNTLLYTSTGSTGYGTSGQVSLRFYDPGVSSGGTTNNAGGLLIRLSANDGQPSNTTSPFALYIYQGNLYKTTAGSMAWNQANPIGSYSLRTANELTFVFNNTAAAISYDGGQRSVASGTMDIWLNGQLLASGIEKSSSTSVGTALKSIAFNASSASTAITQMYLDDISLSDSITVSSIPEPAHATLLVGALITLGILARRRVLRHRG